MKVSIKYNNGRLEDSPLPYCPPQVYEELEKDFNLNYLIGHNCSNNDEHIGYIRGVMDVLARVKILANINNDEE